MKPLMIAIAFALGASAPAFAQSTAADNTNSRTAPAAVAPGPVNGTASTPVMSGSSTPVVSGSAAVAPIPDADEEHGGVRNRLRDHDANERNAAAAGTAGTPATSDDARERAERAATTTSEEEHGGLRNQLHQKKDRARAKVGMRPDDEH